MTQSLIATDPRFAEYMRLGCPGGGQGFNAEAYARFNAYLEVEPLYTKLLREAILDEETYIWYAERDCEIKGYQWYQSAQFRYVKLAVYALGMIQGFTVEELDAQMEEAMNEARLSE